MRVSFVRRPDIKPRVETDLKNRIVTGRFPCLALRVLRTATCRMYFRVLLIGMRIARRRKGAGLSCKAKHLFDISAAAGVLRLGAHEKSDNLARQFTFSDLDNTHASHQRTNMNPVLTGFKGHPNDC